MNSTQPERGACADCGGPIHLTEAPPLPGKVYYHDNLLDMWKCPGHGPVRNADAERCDAEAVGLAPVTYKTSPNGVVHMVPATGPCATCGQGRHDDWPSPDEFGIPDTADRMTVANRYGLSLDEFDAWGQSHDCPKADLRADPVLITFGVASVAAQAAPCSFCDTRKPVLA